VISGDGQLIGLATLGVVSIFDADGRFAPRYDETDEQIHNTDMIIEAIGQMADISLFGDELTERLEWNRGRLQVDENGRSSESWLWSAGDMVFGPDVVHAVADGHRVADSIEEYLA
jgi:glutamate synthase (NADPH/NADH) small chain